MRVDLDTNVLIRAHSKSKALARRIFAELLGGSHTLVLSNEIILEVTKVLRYPDFQRLYGLSESDLFEYSQFLQSVSDLVVLDAQYRAPLRDPSDLVVLQTADLGMADVRIEICDEISLLMRLAPLRP